MNHLCRRAYQLARIPAARTAFMLVPTQQRFVHARGYNDFYDSWSHIFHEINMALCGCKNTDNFMFAFKKYGKHMTDVQLSYTFWFIGKNQLERNQEFW